MTREEIHGLMEFIKSERRKWEDRPEDWRWSVVVAINNVAKRFAKNDERIQAIRADEHTGRGSCSVVDECFDDAEIWYALEDDGADTINKAIRWAYEEEQINIDQACDKRWGEDDDPELERAREWDAVENLRKAKLEEPDDRIPCEYREEDKR